MTCASATTRGSRRRSSGNSEHDGARMGWQDAKGIKIVTKNFGVAGSHTLSVYKTRGGWEGFKKAITLTPTAIVDEVKKSNLRGRGGAGFSTGMKWSFVPKEAKRVYLVCNADESEPG